jgi:hypothetical protein
MRTLLPTLLLTGAALLGAGAPAAAAPPVVDVSPSLPRGEAPRVPYLDGTVVVDGERRLDTGAAEVRLLGESGPDVVVAVAYADERPQAVLRLHPDGTSTVVAHRVDIGTVVLSADGSTLVADRSRNRRSTVRVIDTATGAVTARRSWRGYVEARDVAAGQVLLVRYRPDRTFLWQAAADRVRTVLSRAAAYADLDTDRISWFTGDPYAAGCFVLARLSDPSRRVWRSCRDAVVDVSPNGRRMLTLHKLTDGLGPSELRLRTATGRLLATYRVRQGWFPHSVWESGRTLLLEVNGPRRSAWVRCTDGACERATATRPAQTSRAALSTPRIIGSWSGSRA